MFDLVGSGDLHYRRIPYVMPWQSHKKLSDYFLGHQEARKRLSFRVCETGDCQQKPRMISDDIRRWRWIVWSPSSFPSRSALQVVFSCSSWPSFGCYSRFRSRPVAKMETARHRASLVEGQYALGSFGVFALVIGASVNDASAQTYDFALACTFRGGLSSFVVSGNYVKGEAAISRADGTLAKSFVRFDFNTAPQPKLAMLLKGLGRLGEWRDL